MNSRDFEQKIEIHAYKLERDVRAKQYQYEARVVAEAMNTLETTAHGIQRQAREEQQQLKEANLAPTEANRVLKRENLLKILASTDEKGQGLSKRYRNSKKNSWRMTKIMRDQVRMCTDEGKTSSTC